MNLDLQAKLLRIVQTGIVQKVGGSKEQQVDVRFVCATNRDPWHEVIEGRFREDLYYRLHVIPVDLPPLRNREGDAIEIAESFLEKFASEEGKQFDGFSTEVNSILDQYQWPGNVRQLMNIIRNIVVLNEGGLVTMDMLPAPLNSATPHPSPLSQVRTMSVSSTETVTNNQRPNEIEPLWLTEKRVIEEAIELCNGNIPKAAALLEISASTIYRKKISWEGRLDE